MTATLAVGIGSADSALAEERLPSPEFVGRTASGAGFRSPISDLKPDWSLVASSNGGRRIAGTDLLSLRRAAVALPPFPDGEQLVLHGGDRIPVRDLTLDGEKLKFRHPALADGKECALPLAAVSLIWLDAPAGAGDAEILLRRLARAARPADRVLLRNGDALDGILGALNEAKLEMSVAQKATAIELDKVAIVALSTEVAETSIPRGPYARITLLGDAASSGTRLSIRSATCADGTTLEAETLFGAKLRVPLGQVAGLDVFQGSATYLSDLKPASYEHQPFLDATWPFVTDGSVTGRDLRLAGGVHDKGLGMHSRSRLTYRLKGPYQRFEAMVGLDEKTGRGGSARVRVLVDGKPASLGTPRELTAGAEPLAISVPLRGARELTLEVDFGKSGNVRDHVNWVDARLVK